MRIGLTYTGNEIKQQNYIDWLKQNNDNIEIIKLSADKNNADENIDALVLTGGIDMYPPLYNNNKLNYANAPVAFQKDRDDFEINIFNESLKKQIPVLAVCRGLQLINCVLGGNMKQDLGERLNEVHWGATNPFDKAHGLSIKKDSLLFEITNADRLVINSAHHQAIDRLGENLKINCFADDGTIEGIEWENKKDKAFFLAVQWHPERMYKFHLENSPASKNIRDRFIEEIKKSIN